MSNEANGCVDGAHPHVNSILANKYDTKQLLEIKTELEQVQKKIQQLDTNYQKMAQNAEVLCRNISKLVVQDVIMAAKTKISFQQLQETQSRHNIALQHHQLEAAADMKHKADSKHVISIEESLESLKATQVQQSERMNEILENVISRVQLNERNTRRLSKTGLLLEESIEGYQELSHEELKRSLQNVSQTRLYEQAVNRVRLDSGVNITSTETLQLQLQDECPTSSLLITSPDTGFNSLVPTRETSPPKCKSVITLPQ